MAAVNNSKVQVGIVVKIQRSDGMVHEANITAVSYDHSKIKVEWLENSLVKGKEIDFDTLVLLNPELSEDILPLPSKPVMMTRANSRRTITAQKINQPSEIPRPSRLRASAMLQPPKEADAELSNSNASTRRATISTAKKTKESEKSKKQDRRTQLQEIREKRAQEFDTSNPNWEFVKMIKEFRATLDYRPLSVSDPIDVHKICVCVRKRPLSKLETSKKEVDVVTLPTKNVVLVHEPKLKVDLTKYLENQSFRFDYAFDENVNNEDVYRLSAAPLVQTIFERGMATCFAYGQTGSGKTHWVDDGMHNILFYWKSVQLRNVLSNITMGGNFSGKGQDFSKGIYALATQDVFLLLQQPRYKDLNLTVFVTFFEIYSGKVFDLLNKKVNLRILEDNKQQVQIVGLQEQEVFSVADVILMIEVGNSQRTSGQTSVNNNSSRSHAVFQIILRRHEKLHGQFSLIDLAGNERGADTSSANRQTRMEGAEINKSLLALKECIRALGHNNIYTPFRASKLTLVLRDSFIGENSRTCMIAMISPGLNSCEHTLNTLRYSDRVKELGVHEGASCEPEIPNTSKDINENETMEQSDIRLLYQKNPGETEVLSENQEMVETYDHFALDVPQEEPALICDMHLDVSRVLELEEQILDEHRTIQQKLIQWINADDELLKMAQLPGYNIEMYTDLLQRNINERLITYQEFNKNLTAFRQALQKEEQAAQTIQ